MLQAHVSFAGPTLQLLNYLGNCKAIQAPTITRTGVGQYTVTFLTAREIDAAKIASAMISVECQSPPGTLTFTNVIPSPVAVFNANANSGYTYQVSFKIEVQQIIIVLLLITAQGFVDRPVVMLNIFAKNQYAPGYVHHESLDTLLRNNYSLEGLAMRRNQQTPDRAKYTPTTKEESEKIRAEREALFPAVRRDIRTSEASKSGGVYQALRTGGEEFR
jgi:hypothetical protein